MTGPATELIHAGESEPRHRRAADDADLRDDDVRVRQRRRRCVAYNEGRSTKYLYSRYANPTVVSVEAKLAALDRAEAALLFSSGRARRRRS